MKKPFIPLVGFALVCLMCSCSQNKPTSNTSETIPDSSIISSGILEKSVQEKLTPDEVIASLKEGNHDFASEQLTVRDHSQKVREAFVSQYPKAIILSCIDSRVMVEDVFHKGIGDLFVARVAGNVVDEDVLGSLEYACKESGSKVIVVLGHEHCGAIKAAIDDVKLGNITTLLAKIQPAVQSAKSDFKEEASSKNDKFTDQVCKQNVLLVIETIRKQSPVLKEMEQAGQIKIIGAIYRMNSGVVDFL